MKKELAVAVLLALGSVMVASAADAKATWDKDCAKCHGDAGKGDKPMGKKLGVKDFSDAKVQADMKDDAAFKAIKEGVKDKEDKVLMKPAEGVTDDEIKALVQYVRGFKK